MYDRKRLKDNQPIGLGGVILNANAGRDKRGRKLVLVKWGCSADCRVCKGQPKLVRADNLTARYSTRRTVSCGKVGKALRSAYMREQNARIMAGFTTIKKRSKKKP